MNRHAARQLAAAASAALVLLPAPAWGSAADLENSADSSADGESDGSGGAVAATANIPSLPPSATPLLPSFKPQEELLLEVRTEKYIISDAIAGYSSPHGVYLPLGDFARMLDLAIAVDGDAGRAEGWFLDEERTFRLDIGSGFVELSGERRPLKPGDAVAANGDIFVPAKILADWLPLTAEVVLARQHVFLTLLESFPFQERIARDQARDSIGAGRATRIEYPREETLYAWMTPPALDVNIRSTAGSQQAFSSQYDVRASGDLAFMNTDLFIAGSRDDPLQSIRATMRRRDPDGDLLGPLGLTLVEFGDTSSITQPLGMRSRTGRGLVFGNLPLNQESVFDRIDLRGELPLGYEVELYRNDVLIGSVDRPVDGRYEFIQVPLEFGLNVLRLVFYGPRGERREEVRQINAGEGRLGAGELQFSGSLVQQDRPLFELGDAQGGSLFDSPDYGALRGAAMAQYGLSSALTVVGGLASFADSGRRRYQGMLGLRTSLFGSAVQVDAASQGKGSHALQTGLAGRALGASFVLQHVEYAGDFVDETRGGGSGGMRRVTQLRLDRGIAIGEQQIATNLVGERAQDRSGRVEWNASLRTSTSVRRWLVSNILNYRQSGGSVSTIRSLNGALETSGTIADWGLRAGLAYEISPTFDLRQFNATLDRELGGGMLFRTAISQEIGESNDTRLGLSLARRLGFLDVSADAQYDTGSDAFILGTRMSFSFGRGIGGWGFDPPGLARGGSMLAIAFRDLDGDGLRDDGEPGLEKIGFRGGAGGEVLTDASGMALITGLGDGRPAQVSFLTDSLPDPFLSPTRPGVEVVPRPGRTHVAMFPVAVVSEVEGRAYFQGESEKRAVSNVQLELVDGEDNVIATARTEYDGFFLFERVPPGDYSIRLAPDQKDKLKVRLAERPAVKAGGDGGLVDGIELLVVRGENIAQGTE